MTMMVSVARAEARGCKKGMRGFVNKSADEKREN
jgi:hypothetical protein